MEITFSWLCYPIAESCPWRLVAVSLASSIAVVTVALSAVTAAAAHAFVG